MEERRLRALAQFEREDVRAVQDARANECERAHVGERERHRARVAADVRARARLVEVERRTRSRGVAERGSREVERLIGHASALQRGEERLLPLWMFVQDDQFRRRSRHGWTPLIVAQSRAMIRVRAMTTADAADWLRMRHALWPDDSDSHAREIDGFLAGDRHESLEGRIALDDAGGAVGFAELSIRNIAEDCITDRVGYLEGWYVEPWLRRQGVGAALVRAAEAWARAQGCTEFGSDTTIDNEASAAAHRALGFTETARIRTFLKRL